MSESFPPIPGNVQGLTVAWFRESDWPRWVALNPDFQPDYQYWLRRAEAAFQHYRKAGVPIIKVEIDPDEFLAWSEATGSGVGSSARTRYVVITGIARDEDSDRHA